MIMAKLFKNQATGCHQRAVTISRCLSAGLLTPVREAGVLSTHSTGDYRTDHGNYLFFVALVLALYMFVSPVHAVTVNMTGTNVTSITGFQPGGPLAGNTYNIDFAYDTFSDIDASHDFIFMGEQSNAFTFVYQLDQLLDNSGALTTGGLSDYWVPYEDQVDDVNTTGGIYNQNLDQLWGQQTGAIFSKDLDIVNWALVSEVPVPGALWLFGSALLGLAGIARRKKAA
jgi:hypothetical protein